MIWDFLEKYRDHGLLVLRVGFGLGFLWFHGIPKIQSGPEYWNQVGMAMGNFGITFAPTFWGFLATAAESLGAVFFAAGFLFRPVSLILAFVMAAAAVNHIVTGEGTAAHAFKNLWVFLGLFFVGPGRFSVDAWLRRK